MNIRWNLILAVITLGLLAWFYTLHQDDEKLTDLIKPPEKPEYIGQKMETVVFSPTGEKQYVALSDKVEHFTFDGHTDFTKPVVYVLDVPINKDDTESAVKNQIESWKLTADKATLSKDNMLSLKGNVVAQSLVESSKLQRIATESAVVNLKTQDITSNSMVTIKGQNLTSTGLKLTGNLKQQIATLKEQVKTHYEIQK
ncbi:MAG: LPS export ABC transporter periplasmic protein LptC [[Actinobacillus] rossii]|uniref:Lipopolysaccharide export system protein LptC n=1 Tax=[Actinobacillus] rossii TaxID=123820 RepID=A0A380TR43_9PAST|nr:LPS export ABC transporter periplasmic protein LptC [[Actinobacillus] rossii]MDY4506681.1 LPS export ABC transporter periplasmic protein LptC [[Actinobacillus] rossii]SUT89745.1 Lipopolysaccharide export system protein lptC [[Actinobacillus] rossii]